MVRRLNMASAKIQDFQRGGGQHVYRLVVGGIGTMKQPNRIVERHSSPVFVCTKRYLCKKLLTLCLPSAQVIKTDCRKSAIILAASGTLQRRKSFLARLFDLGERLGLPQASLAIYQKSKRRGIECIIKGAKAEVHNRGS